MELNLKFKMDTLIKGILVFVGILFFAVAMMEGANSYHYGKNMERLKDDISEELVPYFEKNFLYESEDVVELPEETRQNVLYRVNESYYFYNNKRNRAFENKKRDVAGDKETTKALIKEVLNFEEVKTLQDLKNVRIDSYDHLVKAIVNTGQGHINFISKQGDVRISETRGMLYQQGIEGMTLPVIQDKREVKNMDLIFNSEQPKEVYIINKETDIKTGHRTEYRELETYNRELKREVSRYIHQNVKDNRPLRNVKLQEAKKEVERLERI